MPRKTQDRSPSPGQGFMVMPGETLSRPKPVAGAVRAQLRKAGLLESQPAQVALALRLAHDIDAQGDPTKALPLLRALSDLLSTLMPATSTPAGPAVPQLREVLEGMRAERDATGA